MTQPSLYERTESHVIPYCAAIFRGFVGLAAGGLLCRGLALLGQPSVRCSTTSSTATARWSCVCGDVREMGD